MPKLRNPGLYSVLVFLIAACLVAWLTFEKVPEAAKLAGELVALAVAAFGAKSALAAKRPPADRNASKAIAEVSKLARPPMPTWPDFPAKEEAPDTVRNPPKDGAA